MNNELVSFRQRYAAAKLKLKEDSEAETKKLGDRIQELHLQMGGGLVKKAHDWNSFGLCSMCVKIRCIALRPDGGQCKSSATPGLKKCYNHLKEDRRKDLK